MANTTSHTFFSSSNFHFNSRKPSNSNNSTSVRFERTRVSAKTDSSSLYEVLGVGVGADTVAVKTAYRRLARVLHPDVGSCESSADEFMKVHSAYLMLVDPEKRAAYDRSLVSPVRVSGGYRTRRWETDQCW
ncbi:uncharacterized protein LOC143552017 [Bidens hawaiensis]|uniref:uncharacterized protein LOC143552017 n=1 Tax=Bidens hawaiensis TaxID=980011 RepID=UPI0040493BE5